MRKRERERKIIKELGELMSLFACMSSLTVARTRATRSQCFAFLCVCVCVCIQRLIFPPSRVIRVRNLPLSILGPAVKAVFEQVGEVLMVEIIRRPSGKSLGTHLVPKNSHNSLSLKPHQQYHLSTHHPPKLRNMRSF